MIIVVETSRPSLAEFRKLLQAILQQLQSTPVATWLSEEKEDAADIGEVVGLMLQAGSSLMQEVDVFLESMSYQQEVAEAGRKGVPDPGADLFDLPESEAAPTRSPRRG